MGCDFGDVNGDGLLDIYVSNIADRFALCESHFLWQSTGKLDEMKHGIAPYIQASEQLGLSRSGWGWDCRLADFDNSGVLQAMQAVGFIKGRIQSLAGAAIARHQQPANRPRPAFLAELQARRGFERPEQLGRVFCARRRWTFLQHRPRHRLYQADGQPGHCARRRGWRRAAGFPALQSMGTVLFLSQCVAQPRRVSRPASAAAARGGGRLAMRERTGHPEWTCMAARRCARRRW